MVELGVGDALSNTRQLSPAEEIVWEERYPDYHHQFRNWYLFLPDYEAFPDEWPMDLVDLVYELLKEHCLASSFSTTRNYGRYVREAQEELDLVEQAVAETQEEALEDIVQQSVEMADVLPPIVIPSLPSLSLARVVH